MLLWPFVFILTDTINEYFGVRGVRFISWVAAVFIAYAFLTAYLSIALSPADFWVSSNAALGVPDVQNAYAQIFGQGLWTIGWVTHRLPDRAARRRGDLPPHSPRHRRAARLAARHGLHGGVSDPGQLRCSIHRVRHRATKVAGFQFLAVGTVNYLYKMTAAIVLIPLLYFMRKLIRGYLGEQNAQALELEAARSS